MVMDKPYVFATELLEENEYTCPECAEAWRFQPTEDDITEDGFLWLDCPTCGHWEEVGTMWPQGFTVKKK